MSTSTWTNERIVEFINEVHAHPELWNVKTEIYKDKNAKKYAWAVIGDKFDISGDEAYKKFRSLRTYAKNEEKKKKGEGRLVKWFAFDAISFILNQDNWNSGLDSECYASVEMPEGQDIENNADNEEAVDSDTNDTTFITNASKAGVMNNPYIHKTPNYTDPLLEKYRLLNKVREKRRNEYACFGEHIANKLSKYDPYTRAQAEFKIMQVLFECDMGFYRNPAFAQRESPDNIRAGPSSSHNQHSEMSPPCSAVSNTMNYHRPQYIAIPKQNQLPSNTLQLVIDPLYSDTRNESQSKTTTVNIKQE